eukprot:1181080-Prorocentrum_minimum.AAC.5
MSSPTRRRGLSKAVWLLAPAALPPRLFPFVSIQSLVLSRPPTLLTHTACRPPGWPDVTQGTRDTKVPPLGLV